MAPTCFTTTRTNMRRTAARVTGVFATVTIAIALPLDAASAQTRTPSSAADGLAVTWRASAGRESFAFQDLAKSRPPVDGSPIVWRGEGPALTLDYSRRRPFRLHRFELTASTNGDFVYDTGVSVASRPAADAASFLTGQYDYRRYFGRRVWLTGLHAGVGVRGIGGRRTLRHTFGGDVELTETDVTGTIALVGTLRFTRSERFDVEAEWTNGTTLAHGNQHHVADVTGDSPSWGGGWLTVIGARGDVRLRRRLSAVFWVGRDGEGLLFNHRSHTATRGRVLFGVAYAR
jgi:hypothetical protein